MDSGARSSPVSYVGKRCLDVLAAGFGLVVLSPVMAVVAVCIRLTMGPPVVFRQRRPGFREAPFYIVKFRSMNDRTGEDGRLLPDGERLTALGRFLRVTSLDELPEFWNVVRGDMSLVGPRPLLFRYVPFYSDRERTRHLARPGITGLAQVSGRNLLGWDDRLELDAVYVETMSFGLDLKILARTVVNVILGSGAHADVDTVETWLDEERAGSNQAAAAPSAHDGEGG